MLHSLLYRMSNAYSVFIQQLAQWGNSLEEALYRYGTSHHKAAAISTIDHHCKTSHTLTYGKLPNAYCFLNGQMPNVS